MKETCQIQKHFLPLLQGIKVNVFVRQEPKRKDKSQKWFFLPLCCSWDNPRQSSWDIPGLNETCVMTSTKMQRDCCFVSPCCLSVCLIRICIQADTTPHKLQVHVCVCVMGFYPTPPIRTHRQQTQTLIFLNKISNKLFPNHSKQLKCHKIDRLYYQYYQTSITRETGTSRWILGIKQGDTDWKTKSDIFQLLLECWDILLQ